jgi:hypothetical protein
MPDNQGLPAANPAFHGADLEECAITTSRSNQGRWLRYSRQHSSRETSDFLWSEMSAELNE